MGKTHQAHQTTTPTPDPTVLTTEALERAVSAERDYISAQLDVLKERLRGIDRATALLNETVNRTPTEIQKEVVHLRELMDERSRAVDNRFASAEQQRLEQKADTRAAVDAALAAAKEAVKEQTTAFQLATNKSEMATLEQLKQLNLTITTAINGQMESHNDLKTRVERIENVKQGVQENKAGIYMAIVGVGALIGILLFFMNNVAK
jgi:hypothetical protein